jgi:hypothetical protein
MTILQHIHSRVRASIPVIGGSRRKHIRIRTYIFCCIAFLGVIYVLTRSLQSESRPITVRDCIEMTTFSDPAAWDPESKVTYSPNEKYFSVVTSRGMLRSDQIESILWLFNAQSTRHFVNAPYDTTRPQPRLLVRFSGLPAVGAAVPNAAIISDVRWSADSKAVFFLASDRRGRRRLYSLKLAVGERTRMVSRVSQDVRQFDITNSAIVYTRIESCETREWPSTFAWRTDQQGCRCSHWSALQGHCVSAQK